MTGLRTKIFSGFAAFAVAGALSLAASAPAQAYVVDDWTLDLNGVDGLAFSISDIDQIGFVGGVAHSVTNDNDISGTVSTGDTGTVFGIGSIDAFRNDFLGVLGNHNLGTDWEMTFEFEAGIVFVDNLGHFTHTSTGFLDLYIDNLNNGGVKATPGSGAGYTDGVLVASFDLLPGQGGSLNLATLDGSDDATFLANFLMAGVFLDGLTDLLDILNAPGGGLVFGWTDSNFDADPDQDGILNTSAGGFNCGSNLFNFCALEDGSMRLAVPEPGTLAVFAVGLLGLGLARRRRRKA